MKSLSEFLYYHEIGPPDIKIYLGDALEVMPLLPKVDLVVTDPPYGINMDAELHNKKGTFGYKDYGDSGNWDSSAPTQEIFNQMRLISKDQIIWGGNYFADKLPVSMGWLVWDKGQRDFSLADGELAWTSFDQALRIKSYSRSKALQDGKRHPTQKSLTVMKWSIQQCKYWDTPLAILDPFMGSGTTLVAAKELKRNCIGIEIHEPYAKIAKTRLQNTIVPFL